MQKKLFALVALSGVGVAIYAIVAYTAFPLGRVVHPEMRRVFQGYWWIILPHVFGASVALVLGPLQFLSGLRARWPRAHRVTGRVYLLIGVLVGGGAGLAMSPLAFGGAIAKVGFGVGALVWLYTGWKAFASARARRFDEHRDWMIRNYAMALAAVTLRIGLGVGFGLGWPFEVFYPALAWLSWLPNLAIAEMIVRQGRARGVRAEALA